jgi:beta-lactamase class A
VKSNENTLWEHLHGILEEKLGSFPGLAGLCLRDLKSGVVIEIRGDEQFPMASTIKMHILAHLLVPRGREAGLARAREGR